MSNEKKEIENNGLSNLVSEYANRTICGLLSKAIDLGIEVDIKKKEETK